MKQLYQWLSKRASFFRRDVSGRGTSRTIRTEVSVEHQGTTLLVGGISAGFDTCPLCGQKRVHNSQITKETQDENDKQQRATQPLLDDGSRGSGKDSAH